MRDPKVEQFLHDEGYDWDYHEELAFDRLTLDLNPARWEEKLDDDRVRSIGIDVERGMKMPAIVVCVTASSLFALLSGRHRIEGCRLSGRTSGAAYVITSVLDNFELEFLPYALNNKEGRSPTQESKLRQAAYFLKKAPERSKAQIARKLGLKVSAVDHYIKLEHAGDRAIRLNVLTDFRRLSDDNIRIACNEVLKLDTVFSGAVQCLAFTKSKGRAARGFIKDLSEAPSENGALEMMRAVSEEYEEELKRMKRAGQRTHVRTPDQKFILAIGNTLKLWPEHSDLKGISERDLRRAKEKMLDMRGHINEWLDRAAEVLATHEKSRKDRPTEDGVRPFGPG